MKPLLSRDAPPLPLAGTVAWVTGASRGLGRLIAMDLARAGAQVAVTARDQEALDRLCDEIAVLGGDVVPVPGTVTDSRAINQAAEALGQRWGRVDLLVNNAGVSPTLTRSADVDDREWSRILEVNLSGAFYCARAVFPYMQGGGSIVNISSVHASAGLARLAAYAASKGGLEALTKALAVEWADRNIRVNAVAPGYLETEMTAGLLANDRWRDALLDRIPLRRFGTPGDVVPLIIFLASAEASYVTGATFAVDGGWLCQ